MDYDDLTAEERSTLGRIRQRKQEIVREHRLKKSAGNNNPVMPKKTLAGRSNTSAKMKESLGAMGIDTSKAVERARSQSRGRKRERSASRGAAADAEMEGADGENKKRVHSSKSRSMSRGRSLSMAEPKPGSGLKDVAMRNRGIKLADKAQWRMNKMAKIGEADRVIQTKMPKHLFSGKTKGQASRDRR